VGRECRLGGRNGLQVARSRRPLPQRDRTHQQRHEQEKPHQHAQTIRRLHPRVERASLPHESPSRRSDQRSHAETQHQAVLSWLTRDGDLQHEELHSTDNRHHQHQGPPKSGKKVQNTHGRARRLEDNAQTRPEGQHNLRAYTYGGWPVRTVAYQLDLLQDDKHVSVQRALGDQISPEEPIPQNQRRGGVRAIGGQHQTRQQVLRGGGNRNTAGNGQQRKTAH
jgi:hypothetical protein